MKKLSVTILALVLIGVLYLLISNSKTNQAYYIQDQIRAGHATVIGSRDGTSGHVLEASDVDALLDQFQDYAFQWKIDLRPSGGWTYRVDLEIEDKTYRIVFHGKDSMEINGDEFFISQAGT